MLPSLLDMRQAIVIVGVTENAEGIVAKPAEFCDLGSLPLSSHVRVVELASSSQWPGSARSQHGDRPGSSPDLSCVLTLLHSAGQSVGA